MDPAQPQPTENPDPRRVAFRFRRNELWTLALIAAFFVAALVGLIAIGVAVLLLLLFGAIVVVCVLAVLWHVTYRLVVDDEGIARRSVLRSSRIRWSDVVRFEVNERLWLLVRTQAKRPCVIRIETYKDPQGVYAEIARHLGEPKPAPKRVVPLPRLRLAFVLCCIASVPAMVFVHALVWVLGVAVGVFMQALLQLIQPKTYKGEKSRGMWLGQIASVLPVILFPLLGIPESLKTLRGWLILGTFVVGLAVGTLGVLYLVRRRREGKAQPDQRPVKSEPLDRGLRR